MTAPDNMPPRVAEVMMSCFAKSPDERPTFENIVKQFEQLTYKADIHSPMMEDEHYGVKLTINH